MPTENNHLTGGVMADAIKIGQTVRRTASPATSTIHAFLQYLFDHGFTQVPRPLGTDQCDREVLSFVEGRAGHPPITEEIASDEALCNTAAAIRAFHDASVGFTADGWNTGGADPTGRAEIICHNDLAPFNVIYQHCAVAAIIDWDGAAPGRRVWDLAYAAWRLVPLHRPQYTQPLGWPQLDRAHRLSLFADAYGMTAADRSELIPTIRQRQLLNREGMHALARTGRVQQLDPTDPRAESGDLPYLDQHAERWHHAVSR